MTSMIFSESKASWQVHVKKCGNPLHQPRESWTDRERFPRPTDFPNYDLEITMPTKTQDTQHKDQEEEERQQLSAVIGKHVIQTLGQPDNFHSVQVRRLWKDNYRVNVLVGENASSVKFAHSYFLEADSDGNIITSIPTIAKQY
jgi:hypothetical protein